MKGIDDLEASDFFTMNTREPRGHGMKIVKQTNRLNLWKFRLSTARGLQVNTGWRHRTVIVPQVVPSSGLTIGVFMQT